MEICWLQLCGSQVDAVSDVILVFLNLPPQHSATLGELKHLRYYSCLLLFCKGGLSLHQLLREKLATCPLFVSA